MDYSSYTFKQLVKARDNMCISSYPDRAAYIRTLLEKTFPDETMDIDKKRKNRMKFINYIFYCIAILQIISSVALITSYINGDGYFLIDIKPTLQSAIIYTLAFLSLIAGLSLLLYNKYPSFIKFTQINQLLQVPFIHVSTFAVSYTSLVYIPLYIHGHNDASIAGFNFALYLLLETRVLITNSLTTPWFIGVNLAPIFFLLFIQYWYKYKDWFIANNALNMDAAKTAAPVS